MTPNQRASQRRLSVGFAFGRPCPGMAALVLSFYATASIPGSTFDFAARWRLLVDAVRRWNSLAHGAQSSEVDGAPSARQRWLYDGLF